MEGDMDINNLRSMAMFTDIMTNGATESNKMVNRLQNAQMVLNMADSMQSSISEIQAKAVATLMGVGSKVDTFV